MPNTHRLQRAFTNGIAAFLLLITLSSARADRPNVVFLLSDDQAWNDYGFTGQPLPLTIAKPNSSVFISSGGGAVQVFRTSPRGVYPMVTF